MSISARLVVSSVSAGTKRAPSVQLSEQSSNTRLLSFIGEMTATGLSFSCDEVKCIRISEGQR